MVPKDLLYTKEHEWLRVEGETGVIGVTDFAQHELGEVVFVDLPGVGDTFEVEDEIGTVESVKAVAEIYTPIGGEVVEINERLEDEPELLNDAPHGEGWLVKIRLSNPADTEVLMSAEQYEALTQGGE